MQFGTLMLPHYEIKAIAAILLEALL